MRLRNPFIRRINRHTTVSTIFRMPERETIAQRAVNRITQTPVPRPAAVARMLPHTELENLPKGRLAHVQPLRPGEPIKTEAPQEFTEIIQQAERPVGQMRPPQPPPSLSTSQAAEALPARSIQRETQGEINPPSDALEQDWPRLQNILRKHQEIQEQPSAEAAQQGESATGEQPFERSAAQVIQPEPGQEETPGDPAGQSDLHSVKETAPEQPALKKPTITYLDPQTVEPRPVQRARLAQPENSPEAEALSEDEAIPKTQEPAAVERMSEETDISKRQTADDIEEASSQPTMVSGTQSVDSQASREEPVETPSVSAEPLFQRQPESSGNLEAAATSLSAGDEAGETKEDETLYLAEENELVEEPMDQDASQGEEQLLPLESAWPVQRMETYPPDAPTRIIQATEADSQEEELPEPTAAPQGLQEVLDSIAVGQPTDSPVELITPRRPRPKAPASQAPVQAKTDRTADTENAQEETFFETPVQTRPEESLEETGLHEPPRTEISQSPASPAAWEIGPEAPIQKQADEADRPRMVETDIGPLPADLWRLMGETPPDEPAADEPEPIAAAQTEVEQRAAPQKSETSAAGGATRTTERQRPRTAPSPLVQRTLEPTLQREAETQAESGQTESRESTVGEGEEGQEEKINTDELAKKVYSYLKRKLKVEWERLRKG